MDTVIVVAGRTGVITVSPARLRAARKAATPTVDELAARRRRVPGGITQAELAARIGHTGPGAVHQWERGRHRMDVTSLAAVARALHVDPLELVEPGTPVTLSLLRKRAGLTQAAVAAAIGTMGRTTWAEVEAGRRGLLPDEIQPAAAALGVTITQLINAVGATPDSAPRIESLPAELVDRLDALRQPGESVADVIAGLLSDDEAR